MQTVTLTDPRSTDYFYEEAVKTLRTNIQFAGRDIKTIVFTSCFPNEGKSDVTFQLAREIGNIGKQVLYLDTYIRKSALVSRYQIRQSVKGLSQYLSGQVSDAEDIVYATNYPNMDIIFAGRLAPNPAELLEEEAFAQLLQEKRAAYDYVLIDTPPIATLSDASIVAKLCDGAVLVVESEAVSYRTAQRAAEQLERTGCRLLGVVLNKVDLDKLKHYGHRYEYYHYYGKDKKGGGR